MVKQPLAKVESPLAACGYLAVAEQERVDSLNNLQATKPAFIEALKRRLAE